MPKSLQNQDMIRRVLSSRAEARRAWVAGFFRDGRVRELSPYTIPRVVLRIIFISASQVFIAQDQPVSYTNRRDPVAAGPTLTFWASKPQGKELLMVL